MKSEKIFGKKRKKEERDREELCTLDHYTNQQDSTTAQQPYSTRKVKRQKTENKTHVSETAARLKSPKQ